MGKGNMSQEACNKFLQQKLIPELKSEIFKAKNSDWKNLNDYFKNVINPMFNIN